MTNEEEAQVAMYMRVIDFFRNHEEVLNKNEEMLKNMVKIKSFVQQIFDLLSEEDLDRLLERYKNDLTFLNMKKI